MKRFSSYALSSEDKGTAETFNARFRDIDGRLDTLETREQQVEERIEAVVADARTRVDAALLPAFERLQAYQTGGFLSARLVPEAAFELEVGITSIGIHPDDRDLFIPSPFVAITRASTPDDWAIASRESWNAETGVLGLDILDVFGDAGPHDDIVIWATAGSAQAQAEWLAQGKSARDTTVAAANTVTNQTEIATAAAETATTKATLATTKADLAEDWAENAEDVVVTPGHYSSKHHAIKAAASAAAAIAAANSIDTEAIQDALDLKAPLASPALTGNPTAPTQTGGNNSTRLATTAFVAGEIATAIAALINGAPGALNTLVELATAMGNDANFATTVTNALAGKLSTANGAVGTSNIADAAVTFAKLAAAVVPDQATAELGTATDKLPNVLRVAQMIAALAPKPGLVLLQSQTVASQVASVDFTTGISSTYDEYELHIVNARPATDAVYAYLTTGAGSFSATNYIYTGTGRKASDTAGSVAGEQVSSSSTKIDLTMTGAAYPVGNANDTLEGYSGIVRMLCKSAGGAGARFLFESVYGDASGVLVSYKGAGRWDAASTPDRLRFAFSSGNIQSGAKLALFGVRKT